MNERIRELYTEVVGVDKLAFDSYLAEKFAEEIVRECIQEISHLMDYNSYPDNAEKSTVELKALRDARQVIKEHFGIKL
jgi:hypothetical protein